MKKAATIVVDLGFGDAGKGSIVDFLTRRQAGPVCVVRFNGGPQAAHTVVTDDGRQHTFAHFGSGLFVPGTTTHLGPAMLINPFNMSYEEEKLRDVGIVDAVARTTIDHRCLVVTPLHLALNRIRETQRGSKEGRHGSCGQGVGETVMDSLERPDLAIRALDLGTNEATRKIREIRDYKVAQAKVLGVDVKNLFEFTDEGLYTIVQFYRQFDKRYRIIEPDPVFMGDRALILEGAQGVLLDEVHGFAPYNTWSDTTYRHGDAFLNEIRFNGDVERLGVVRAYSTRHGAGPFPSESCAVTAVLQDRNNPPNDWQGRMRFGWFDAVLIRYAVRVCQWVDSLAITCLDQVENAQFHPEGPMICDAYRAPNRVDRWDDLLPCAGGPGPETTALLKRCLPMVRWCRRRPEDEIAQAVGVPLSLVSRGPTAADKVMLSPVFPVRNNGRPDTGRYLMTV